MQGDLSGYFTAGFNADAVDTSKLQGEFEPLPPGWYTVHIDTAAVQKTQRGDGAYVALEATVVSGTHEGRKVWDRIMLQHPNPDAVTMGHARLATLARAIGKPALKDTSALVGCNAEARVVIGKKEYEGRKRNEVKEYRAKSTAAGARPAPAPAGRSDGLTAGRSDGLNVSGSPPSIAAPVAAPAAAPVAAPVAASPAAPKPPPWLAGKAAAAVKGGAA